MLAFAMGYVEGESVAERVRRAGPLDVRSMVRLLQDVGYALAYAHGRGVVHRDIKPDNIMLERATGRALLMDFGISRSITANVDGKGKTQGLTRVGEVVGTAEYMGDLASTDPGIAVKLPDSHAQALSLDCAKPSGYGLGKAGWVNIQLTGPDRPSADVLCDWVEESYRAIAPKKLIAELDA